VVPSLDIVVHYNIERGFEEPALRLARRLFAELDEAITSLALFPVADEDLDVYLNGHLVHSTTRAGRPPRVAEILAARAATDRHPPPTEPRTR